MNKNPQSDKSDTRSASNQAPNTPNPDKSRGKDQPDHRENTRPDSESEEEE
jgi:hypothetical protein